MKTKPTLHPFLALAASSLLVISSAHAAGPYYWDGNDSTSGFATAGGTWADPTVGTAASGWSTSNTGITVVDGNSVSTTTADSINFGANTTGNGLAAGTITVSGIVNSGSITVGSQSGSGLKLDGGTINFANAVTITSNLSLFEISSVIIGASTSLSKLGVNGTLRLSNASSTYSGFTSIVGSIQAASLANGGSNSSIGSSSSAASNLRLGGGGGQGTLSYIGSGNASTDRSFTLNDSAGSVISNDGSGTLEFTSTSGLAYGSSASGQTRALTLGGSYTGGQNTFRPLIENNGTNATSFIKSGNSTWILANNSNSYTGTTNIAGGTLVIGSIADYGTNSAIGQGTSGAGIIVANGNASGTLIYTGGAQETNRLIQISNTTNAASGIATILNNGTGKLTFTSATFNPTYTNANNLTRTLALGGTNDGVIQGTIQNSSATVKNALTKIGSGTWTLSGTNTYTGATAAQEGNLVAGSNAPSAANGAFGNATSDINLGVAGGNNDAGLLIGGTFTVGRNIRLMTNNTTDTGTRVLTIGGSTADNSEFSGNIILGTNSNAGRGVTLTAAAGGQVTFSGVIQNPTSMDATSYTVTKSGAGTVVLSNTNTYTGATAINQGTLKLGASNVLPDASPVSIGTATLDADTRTDTLGTLDVTGSAVINLGSGAALAFANSSSLTWAGTLNLVGFVSGSSLNFGSSTGLTAAQLAKISASGFSNFSLDAGGNLLADNVGGPGPLDHFAISAIGSLQTVGTPITGITLTAQDASNQTVTSFNGNVTFSGTGGFSGTSATFSSGVLGGVSVTPTNAGSSLTFVVTDGVSGKSGSSTIATIQTQYQAWAGGAAFAADANGDGVGNGLAWLLGASGPNAAVTLPTVTRSSGNLVLTFQCLKDSARGNPTLSVEHSSDLGISDAWLAAPVSDAGTPANNVTFSITSASTTLNNVTATISSSEAAAGKLFGRVKAVNP